MTAEDGQFDAPGGTLGGDTDDIVLLQCGAAISTLLLPNLVEATQIAPNKLKNILEYLKIFIQSISYYKIHFQEY